MVGGGTMSIDLSISLKQKLQISQQQIQSLEILTMDNLELGDLMAREYLENPLFERKEGSFVVEKSKQMLEQVETKEEFSPEAYLSQQIPWILYSKEYAEKIHFFIQGLNEDGYYTIPMEDTARHLGLSIEAAQDILLKLQELEPYGVFARNLKECLLIQIKHQYHSNEVLMNIVENYLDEVGKGKISTISRAYDLTTAQVREIIHLIEKLNPRPFAGMGRDTTEYIIPDIIVEFDQEGYHIQMNDGWMEDYSISDYYLQLMKETRDEELFLYFKKHYERAKLLLKNIESRRTTIIAVAEQIVQVQQSYMKKEGPLQVLKMADIADKLQVNVSTVSRAIKGKYLQYPAKIEPMRSFFCTHAVIQSEQGLINQSVVKSRIRELINEERQTKPLSDAQISELLKEEGIQVSRRTVSKYRKEMGVYSSFERRDI